MKDRVRAFIAPRRKDAHKYDFGHVLVLAGSRGMSGAALMAAYAALRAGAGLVTLALPASLQPTAAAALNPAAMTLGLPDDGEGRISRAALQPLTDYIACRRISMIVAGPGLGLGDERAALLCALLQAVNIPALLDADGLGILHKGRYPEGAETLKALAGRLIVTPHPGEFSRMTGMPVDEIQTDRAAAARSFAAAHGIVCALKGAGTVVSDGSTTLVNTTGNPGMARGGSGDVLSGIIGALVAQVAEPRLFNAALCGVYLHGLAGDIAASEKTELCMLPSDIIESLPEAFRRTMI